MSTTPKDKAAEARKVALTLAFRSLENPRNLIRVAQDYPVTPPGQPPQKFTKTKSKKAKKKK